MRHIAIVGSGPAGFYTAEAAQKLFGDGVRVDMFDRLPVPYGLIRSGVAPDHQSIKAVAQRFEKVALSSAVRFLGNVTIGSDVTIAELRELYDAVVLATGAPHDRPLGIPGADLSNVFGSAAFVGWYNGHSDFAQLAPNLSVGTAVVIGVGNVALDVARILAKSPAEFAGSDISRHALDALAEARIERIVIVGRRGPHQIQMTPKELGELGHLERAAPHVARADLPPAEADAELEPGLRKSVAHLRAFAEDRDTQPSAKPIALEFKFMASPKSLIGTGRVEGIELERTRLVDGQAEGTGEIERIEAGLVVSCIGYRSSPIPDVPFDERAGRFASVDGRIAPGLYCVGWARRGPTGTIGTNRPDGAATAQQIFSDAEAGVLGPDEKGGGAGFDALVAARELGPVSFSDWKKIEQAESAAAREGSPREKFVAVDAMIRASR